MDLADQMGGVSKVTYIIIITILYNIVQCL